MFRVIDVVRFGTHLHDTYYYAHETKVIFWSNDERPKKKSNLLDVSQYYYVLVWNIGKNYHQNMTSCSIWRRILQYIMILYIIFYMHIRDAFLNTRKRYSWRPWFWSSPVMIVKCRRVNWTSQYGGRGAKLSGSGIVWRPRQ